MARWLPSKYWPWVGAIAVAVVVLAVLLVVALSAGPGDGTGESEEGATDQGAPARLPLHYSGNGSSVLGDINLPVNAVLEWTNRPQIPGTGFFSVRDKAPGSTPKGAPADANRIHVKGTRDAGRARLRPGVYRGVRVLAQGQWTMLIRAR